MKVKYISTSLLKIIKTFKQPFANIKYCYKFILVINDDGKNKENTKSY